MLIANLYRMRGELERIIICASYKEALEIVEILKFINVLNETNGDKQKDIFALPDFRAKEMDDLRSYSYELSELLKNLTNFYKSENAILVAPIHSVIIPLPTKKYTSFKTLSFGDTVNIPTFKEDLLQLGYEFVELIDLVGEASFRGDIIDIYPPNLSNPIRISLFDNEIDSIKYFNTNNQMSFSEELESVEIYPALFSLQKEEFNSINTQIENANSDYFINDIRSLGFWFIERDFITNNIPALISTSALEELALIPEHEKSKFSLSNIKIIEEKEGYNHIDCSLKIVESLLKAHKNRTKTLLISNTILQKSLDIPPDTIIYNNDIYINIITPSEIIISLNHFYKTRKTRNATIRLDSLSPGDLVVHDEYGIGIFRGLTQREVLGSNRDFVEISYLGDDKLLLPTHNIHLISKYSASEGSTPNLDRLGKGSFTKTKEKIKPYLLALANEIIALAAKRELIQGIYIDTTLPELLIFKESSTFNLTSDQEKSIEEIFLDLSSGKVMDRLLSGDVGFGKTEVAMNAIYAAVKNGYQAAFIVPTVLLCNQHFLTLKSRFKEHNLVKLDRFSANKNNVIRSIEEGRADIIIGTHGLLNIKYKNLALVVLDEEHKFGVKQKEKIKEMSSNIHVLSMSATPIPRTLNMALSSIKSISRLNIPPLSRQAPKTFIRDYDAAILKDAMQRELRRHGQIFYIHNNIESIEKKKIQLLNILPTLKIAILHSKIDNKTSENIMLDFSNGMYNVMLSTSIIESGIHLPNANTIIVDGADRFGVADLHQLRGRVGRGDKEGYCYFMVQNKESITQDAKRRLLALQNNSFLGAGGILSHSDLDIRGGGNILGEAQSGHIKHIGYSLYLKMLEETLNELTGKQKSEINHVDISLNISAFISHELITSTNIRLEFYRRLANIKYVNELYEIEAEIKDRFGVIDPITLRFLTLIHIKIIAHECGVKNISNYGKTISIDFGNNHIHTIESSSIDDDAILVTSLNYIKNYCVEHA